MKDTDSRQLPHFTTPFRIGNLIIAGLALCFLPMFLAFLVFAIFKLLAAFSGAQ